MAAAGAPAGAQALAAKPAGAAGATAANPLPSEGRSVTVVYTTGWQSAFLHYNAGASDVAAE